MSDETGKPGGAADGAADTDRRKQIHQAVEKAKEQGLRALGLLLIDKTNSKIYFLDMRLLAVGEPVLFWVAPELATNILDHLASTEV